MKKGDIVLIFIVLVAAAIFFGVMNLGGKETGGILTVTIDGDVYGTYDLSVNQVVTMDESSGYNRFEIKDGMVTMIEADCPDQYCVHHASINKENETIVCLPHKVVLEITQGEEQREVDA